MRLLFSKPDSLGDQLIAAGVVQAFQTHRPECRIVWHVRNGMEAIAPLIGATVFHPDLAQPPAAEAARLAADPAPLVLLPYPLSAYEEWTSDVRRRVSWWADFLRATEWDATVLGLVNRTWVGDFTAALARAPVRIGYAANAARQPLVNEAQALAGPDALSFTTTLEPSFVRGEAAQLADLFAVLEPRLREAAEPLVWRSELQWKRRDEPAAPPRVLIAPGVGGDPRRSWGVDHLRRVADALRARGATIAWIEGPDDARYLETLPHDDAYRRLVFGRDDLVALANELNRADLFICHDTAYVHLAAGIGVPTVAIYGAGQHARFHPVGGRVAIVQSDLACAGCQWHCLWDRLVCVADIPIEAVLAAAKRMLAGNATSERVVLQTPVAGASEGEAVAVRHRLQHEILALNADRFARLQIIQSLIDQQRTPTPSNDVARGVGGGTDDNSDSGSPDARAQSHNNIAREPKLSIVVPMGRPERVAPTLASLAAQERKPAHWEIVLVGVGADGVARTHSHLPITPVALERNVLPPRTRCLGVARTTGDWLLFLDDDVELAPDCYARFLELLATPPFAPDAHPPIGALGFRLPGKSGRFFERLTDISNFWAQQHTIAEDRDWLYSAAILVRADAYHRSGGFNPELPNAEDVDLTRRIVAAGFRLRYEPSLVARHDHRRDTLGSMWRYFWRNGNAARYFFAAHGAACPFSVKTVWLKAWSDLQMNRAFQRERGLSLGWRTPLVWLNYLIVEASLELHWQEYLYEKRRYQQLPTRARSDATYVRAMSAWDDGARMRAALRYALAVLQDFANPVRR